jgi:hypothetical protein
VFGIAGVIWIHDPLPEIVVFKWYNVILPVALAANAAWLERSDTAAASERIAPLLVKADLICPCVIDIMNIIVDFMALLLCELGHLGHYLPQCP